MCRLYSQTKGFEEVRRRFGLKGPRPEGFAPRPRIASGERAFVIVREGGERVLKSMQWGLVPHWAKDASGGKKCFNARAETLAERPSFREAFRWRRCLVPADGFFEGSRRRLSRIGLKDGGLFSFAGLWEVWRGRDGTLLETYAVVTTPPNDLIKKIHPRMPAILNPSDEASWLESANRDEAGLRRLLAPFSQEGMEAGPAGPDPVSAPQISLFSGL